MKKFFAFAAAALVAFSFASCNKNEPDQPGLEHDFAEYAVDLSYIAYYGNIDVRAQDDTHALYLEFNVAEGDTDLVAGTYQISATGEVGTVTASKGIVDEFGVPFITPSYAAALNAEVTTLWYLKSGTVIVKEDGSIVIDALNYKGKLTNRVELLGAPARKVLKI